MNTRAAHYRSEPWLSWAVTVCPLCGDEALHFYAAEIHVDFVRLGCVTYADVAPDWVADCWSEQHGLPVVRHVPEPQWTLSKPAHNEVLSWASRLVSATDEEIWAALLSSPA